MSISSGTGAVGGLSVRYAYDASNRVLMEEMMFSVFCEFHFFSRIR